MQPDVAQHSPECVQELHHGVLDCRESGYLLVRLKAVATADP